MCMTGTSERSRKVKITYYMTPRQSHVIYDRLLNQYTLHLPHSTSDRALFAILHEYAHIALGHFSQEAVLEGFGSDKFEIAASRLALRWIRPELQSKAIRFYLMCIAPSQYVWHSYRKEVESQLSV